MTGAPTAGRRRCRDQARRYPTARRVDGAAARDQAARVRRHHASRGGLLRGPARSSRRGKRLTPIDIALLAEIGQPLVQVLPRPRVAVLATGNELVPCGSPVGPGQITNSNSPYLVAALEAVCAAPVDLGICPDDPEQLRTQIADGLKTDVLLITGGVSAGVMDLVPGVLGRARCRADLSQGKDEAGEALVVRCPRASWPAHPGLWPARESRQRARGCGVVCQTGPAGIGWRFVCCPEDGSRSFAGRDWSQGTAAYLLSVPRRLRSSAGRTGKRYNRCPGAAQPTWLRLSKPTLWSFCHRATISTSRDKTVAAIML